jgi:hypothetical protein
MDCLQQNAYALSMVDNLTFNQTFVGSIPTAKLSNPMC